MGVIRNLRPVPFAGEGAYHRLAVYTTQPGRLLVKYGSMVITAWGMLIGGVLLCLIFKPWNIKVSVDGAVIGGMAVIILFGTNVSFGPMDILGFVCIISTIFLLTLGKSR